VTATWQSGDGRVALYCGDCLDVLPTLAAGSVDAVVTDPPYGLAFMGKDWDHGIPGEHFWREVLRVAKPGAYLLAFGGTRTHHRLMCAIEDAGWEIRDVVMWVYGSGFPKSLDASKAIDKAAGAGREVVGTALRSGASEQRPQIECAITAPATAAARQWSGWGTALKPAWEPIIVARKPLAGTVSENVLAHGTGALNIDGCRVDMNGETWQGNADNAHVNYSADVFGKFARQYAKPSNPSGRWPANLIHDGSPEVLAGFPTSSVTGKRTAESKAATVQGTAWATDNHESTEYPGDTGSASRFFYCAKASKDDRDEGCEGLEPAPVLIGAEGHKINPMTGKPVVDVPRRNHHPTVKPTALMRYLCRLVTPTGGVVLDPFMGSGSTGKAALREGFRFIGIDREPEYIEIARLRIERELAQPCLPLAVAHEPETQPQLFKEGNENG
jgi:DNA modification methylase